MSRRFGTLHWSGGSLPDMTRDTFTCVHCQRIVIVAPKQDASTLGGFCRRCMGLICSACEAKGDCTPFMKAIEEQEEAAYRRSQYARILGV